jgi:hypothetical protein
MRNETAEPCPDRHFFAAGCASCIAHWMAVRSLGTVHGAHGLGLIPGSALDGYRHVWATSAVRSVTWDHWKALPYGRDARVFADLLRTILNARV